MKILESLLEGCHVCAGFPTPGAARMWTIHDDIGFGVSLFFMQVSPFCPPRAGARPRTSKFQTLSHEEDSDDNYIRLMLDRSPGALQPCFDQVIEQLRRARRLKHFNGWRRTLVALDGRSISVRKA